MLKTIGMTFVVAVLAAGLSFSQSMKVTTKNSVETFPLAEIDSITFVLDDEGAAAVNKLKIVNGEISGWVENAEGYREFATVDRLRDAINGAADKYFEYGVIDGFKQVLSKSSDPEKTIRYTVMDCGTAGNAAALYNYIKQDLSIKAAAGNFDEATAIIDTDYLTSVRALAHFGKYYAEITPDGFTKSEEIITATTFIEVLKDKISKL
jgi:hypothetical protein